ncbi:trigger factor [Rhodovulum sulfidophilum]|uniref:Trigger factor n=3 Tax=Rhodovulum sulfidophilum TaxID=35806 RepID=A0ABS1RYW1_RHOSU|nr:trigger factor [Rhodovulum sulfidophilum]ANB36177.1 trigger factor [Rhodovulum sulfidophilum DSM 1374]ANB39983.1 trigger factor [Rhodovulum sulfidophilum]MBK5923883.1 trigger factor [Rhodovulum sulfidophilum]MBL3597124.1 trigger factor [Rhodovulum sulfidophilum]MBL3611082.1 trigger factor [Rhodovulum sulfidophilum]
MQVTETLKDGLKRGYTITVTAAELEAKVNEKLAEAQPQIEMKGFRKGKVPMPLLKKQFGERLMGEAMQETIDGAMSSHFEETGDRPAMQPEVKMTNEDWKPGEDVIVEMSYEALPEIPETDLKAIKLEKLVVEPAEAEITEALEKLAGTAQTYADRRKGSKAKDGDQVIIDFVGKLGDEPFEGGSAEDYPLVLGSESFIPGFEAQLVGAKAEDDITVTVTFPENYGAENLKGQEATFDVKVKAVKAPKPAEIDDELAKQFGAEDLDGLKTQVAERLKTEFGGAARAVMKRALLDELDTAVSFEVPPSLLDAEAGQIAHQLYHEEHPDDHGHDHGEIEPSEEHLKLAERRVRLGLLLAEIGRKAEVTVSDNEMTQAVMAQARQFPGQERQFFEYVRQNQALQQQIRAPLFEDKVVDYVFELAEVTEKPVSKDELQAAVEKLEEE